MDSVVVQLISAIKSRPPIYRLKSKTAKNKGIVDRLWKQVAAEMQYSESDCRRKWNILRNCYARTLRNERCHKTMKKSWYLKKELSFLKRYIQPHKALKGDASESIECVPETLPETSEQNCSIDIESSCSPTPVKTPTPLSYIPIDEPLNDGYKTEIDPQEYLNYVHKISDESNCSKISINSSPIPLEEPVVEIHKRQSTDELKNSNQLFLTSLLPDLNSLSERKQRIFKRKTIELLELLFEEDPYGVTTATHYQPPTSDVDSTLSTVQVTAHHYDQPIVFTVTHKDEPMTQ